MKRSSNSHIGQHLPSDLINGNDARNIFHGGSFTNNYKGARKEDVIDELLLDDDSPNNRNNGTSQVP
jgi:hypothetical protein